MRQLRGDLLAYECDAIVVTTNGFTKQNGDCVMGRGIALQVANIYPQLPNILGDSIKRHGNKVVAFDFEDEHPAIVAFPVKPITVISDGTNVVSHMRNKFPKGAVVPGFACIAEKDLIEQSLKQLVDGVNQMGWTNVACPRFGCGAGELSWEEIEPLAERYLDDRFVVFTF